MDTDRVFLLKQEEDRVDVVPLKLDGLPNGQDIETIIEKTIAIEGQLPSVGQELFDRLKQLKQAAIDGDMERVKRHHTELAHQLPAHRSHTLV